jgi:hypothetical protein
MADVIGQRPLRQVVIPGSHDAGTYASFDFPLGLWAQAQDQDITSQLNSGSRYFDIRAAYQDWAGNADYWAVHGSAISTDLRLHQMLEQAANWANEPGHEKEILLLSVLADPATNRNSFDVNCRAFLTAAGNRLLQPSMVPAGTTLYDMPLNDIWALPNHPTIITNWSDCTGEAWPVPPAGEAARPIASRYADHCQSPQQIADALGPYLMGRTDDGGHVASGIYGLFVQGTPEAECLWAPPSVLAPMQGPVLNAISGWREQNQNNALANLNVIVGDFVGSWPIVETAMALNRAAPAPQLTLSPGRVTCAAPAEVGLLMIAYPVAEGPFGPHAQRWQGTGPGQLDLSRTQFPSGTNDVRVDCTSTSNGMTSSLTTIPAGAPAPPPAAVALRFDGASSTIYCTAQESVTRPLTLNIFPTDVGPTSPGRQTAVSGEDGTIQSRYGRDDFPRFPGVDAYNLTATCASSNTPPLMATPITFSTGDLPEGRRYHATPDSSTSAVGQPPAATPSPGSTAVRTPTPGTTAVRTPTPSATAVRLPTR